MSGRSKIETLLKLVNTAAQDAMAEYEKDGQEVPSFDSTTPHPLDSAEDNLALKKAIRLLEGACDQLCSSLAPPAHTIINRGQALDWACIPVVIKAHVADALDGHPNGLPVSEIAKAVGIEEGKLGRILRLLATRSCFLEVRPNVFANSRLSLQLHSSNATSDLALCHTTLGPTAYNAFYSTLTSPDYGPSYEPTKSPFMQAVKDDGIKGGFFDWLKAHPQEREVFGRAMRGLGHVMGSSAVLTNFPWSDFTTVCDVGSGIGAFAMPLARKYPNVKVTLQDLPETIGQAKEVWSKDYPEAVQAQRVDFVPLDFLKASPVKGQDIYYLRNIIHNWPDAEALTILRSVQQSMGPHSRLLVHDYVLQHLNRSEGESTASRLGVDIAPEPLLPNFGAGNVRAFNQDLTMLFMFNAKERTLEESIQMGATAGLRLERAWDLAETGMLEFRLASA